MCILGHSISQSVHCEVVVTVLGSRAAGRRQRFKIKLLLLTLQDTFESTSTVLVVLWE